ncbi:hypothetical protein Tco_0697927, partial [Tanacetum coccineum]
YNNGEGYVPAFNGDGYFPADNGDVDGKLTWQLHNNGGVTTEVNGEFSPNKGMLTWLLDGDGELTPEMKNMLTCQSEFNGDGEVVTDEVKSMLTWQNVDTKGVTDEMLTWQKNEEDEAEELSKFLEASGEMMTCQKTKVKIVNDYPYWLPLKFQTSSAYVTINGNEELCGSSFSDSDTSYMAGISGAWSALADEARGSMEVDWGECGEFFGGDAGRVSGGHALVLGNFVKTWPTRKEFLME